MSAPADALIERARARAASVPDPEIPVVTLADLGILRTVHAEAGRVVVTLTPTYTGCPATQVIADDVRRALAEEGIGDAEVRLTLSPPWTTDWISAEGRRKLREYGIAPPGAACGESIVRFVPRAAASAAAVETIECPRCGSADVERLSEYGSTPCKALYRCLACREPFDYFKPY
ncbi:MAG TPA: 1,2-phenylacetyl-CoA epoxidase subunit PaaD [Burkholderiaceae bacterium]|nr:1,2-phenylacetyl-CoA epoxidase subunit PaaD [Burkholderiaceae bacterium]